MKVSREEGVKCRKEVVHFEGVQVKIDKAHLEGWV